MDLYVDTHHDLLFHARPWWCVVECSSAPAHPLFFLRCSWLWVLRLQNQLSFFHINTRGECSRFPFPFVDPLEATQQQPHQEPHQQTPPVAAAAAAPPPPIESSRSETKPKPQQKLCLRLLSLYNRTIIIVMTTQHVAQQHQPILPPDPFTIDTIEYDFERYAMEHGIPETLDPLPYRKTGSVFGAGGLLAEEGGGDAGMASASSGGADPSAAASVLTSAKNDPRLRTVVCRHWLRDLCMKGAACEFLHMYDLSRMPLCRWGDRCKVKDCPFRHISESNRMECVFYSQGFCIHGPYCRYKHHRRSRDDMPAVADFTLGLSQMQAAGSGRDGSGGPGGLGGAALSSRRPAPKPNEYYKISLCKHFMAGSCPFGENCHFAHGEAELRPYPGRDDSGQHADSEGGGGGMMDWQNDTSASAHHDGPGVATGVDYYQGGSAGGGKPIPILEPDQASYFVVAAASQRDLAISTVRGEWYVPRRHAVRLNECYDNGQRQVMLFFTVSGSRHIQGAALLTSEAGAVDRGGGSRGDGRRRGGRSRDDDRDSASSYNFRILVEWYRTCELSVELAVQVAPDLLLPSTHTSCCEEIASPSTGEALMKLLWNSPLVALYEAWSDDAPEPPAPDALLTDFRCPPPDEVAWPTMPGPGFVFGCSSDTMDECLGRGILGLPAHMHKAASSAIVPGTTIFLFNVTDRLLFGIFEALTPPILDIVPTAFSRNPKATSSPFPVQIRVRISLECPPLEDTDPVLNDILRNRKGRIGAITHAQTQAIASMLAQQCGALTYMVDYQNAFRQGRMAPEPPISLPPRKTAAI